MKGLLHRQLNDRGCRRAACHCWPGCCCVGAASIRGGAVLRNSSISPRVFWAGQAPVRIHNQYSLRTCPDLHRQPGHDRCLLDERS